MAKTSRQKSVCARLDSAKRKDLAEICSRYHRSVKGQIEAWIEQEMRIISRDR